MNCYIVSYQIVGRNMRDQLRSLLREFGAYCPINNTCWAIMTDKSADEIRQQLSPALGARDRLFILRSGRESSWVNAISAKHTDWLKKHL